MPIRNHELPEKVDQFFALEDGRWLLGQTDGRVQLCKSGEILRSYQGFEVDTSLPIDGRFLCGTCTKVVSAVSQSNQVRMAVWDLESGQLTALTKSSFTCKFKVSRDIVFANRLAADNTQLAFAVNASNASAQLHSWNIHTGQQSPAVGNLAGSIACLDVASPTVLVVLYQTGTVVLFYLDGTVLQRLDSQSCYHTFQTWGETVVLGGTEGVPRCSSVQFTDVYQLDGDRSLCFQRRIPHPDPEIHHIRRFVATRHHYLVLHEFSSEEALREIHMGTGKVRRHLFSHEILYLASTSQSELATVQKVWSVAEQRHKLCAIVYLDGLAVERACLLRGD